MHKFNKLYKTINIFLINNIFAFFVLLIIIYFAFLSKSKNPITFDKVESLAHEGFVMNKSSMHDSYARRSPSVLGSSMNSNRKITKVVNMQVEVKNTLDKKKEVERILKNNNSFVERFESYMHYNSMAYNFSIKTPSENLEKITNEFKNMGVLLSESMNTTDKSEHYRDNENQLINLKARRERIREMLKTKTKKLSDVLAVDRALTEVQNSIDRITKSNMTIDQNVKYSSIYLTISPEPTIDINRDKWSIHKSFSSSINCLISFSQKLVDHLFKIIAFLPFALMFAFIAYCFNRIQKREKK